MVIDMNEVQVSTVEKMRQVLAGTQALEFKQAGDDAGRYDWIDAVLRRGYSVEEVTYPFGRGRFARGDTMPWILVSMLPRFADDPDRLFEEVVTFGRRLPEQPLPEHYRALFEWLAARSGRRYWIERSGSSIDYLASLYALFPEARVVHIHRVGREAALSMREHHAYRVPISLMYDAPVASGRRLYSLGSLPWAQRNHARNSGFRRRCRRPRVA